MLATLAGILSGLAAAALEYGLHVGSEELVGRFTHMGQAKILDFHYAILLLPAIGGLAAGLAVQFIIPKHFGHGTDVLIRAFHRNGGKLGMRGPTVNAAACVAVISCGGSAGPEGPVAALGAAIGSSLGRVFALTPRERRVMLVSGCGAGIGAIFQCPLGGALFATGILYRESDYETDAVIPAFVASVIGYSAYMPFWGYGSHLLQHADKLSFTSPRELIPYAILGPLCGLTCFVFRMSLHSVERVAKYAGGNRWIAPTIGGLITGAIACALPQVMDGQYTFIQHAMDGTFQGGFGMHSWMGWAALFGAVAIAKCVATGFTVGSGAPGGVLGPSVCIGGALGACLGAVIMAINPHIFTANPENVRSALIPVGIAGVLSASMRAPLASVVMVAEMTGSYGLIVPSMLVCVTSYVVGRRWGLNDEQVPTSAESPAHAGDLIVHMLEVRTVGAHARQDWPDTVSPSTTLTEMAKFLKPGVQPAIAVVQGNRLMGLISNREISQALDSELAGGLIIAEDVMNAQVPLLRSDDSLYMAVSEMARTGLHTLPVIDVEHEGRFLGVISRTRVHGMVRSQLDEMSKHLFEEHSGLTAIGHEDDVYQLAAGVAGGSVGRVQRLLVPIQAVGQSLRDADFRRNFGVHVIAIEQADGSIQCPPDADAPLATNQRLLAVASEGPKESDEASS